eukprot:6188889-Pleurochrysis_carterae.AAC.2
MVASPIWPYLASVSLRRSAAATARQAALKLQHRHAPAAARWRRGEPRCAARPGSEDLPVGQQLVPQNLLATTAQKLSEYASLAQSCCCPSRKHQIRLLPRNWNLVLGTLNWGSTS